MVLGREAILGADDRQTEVVEVPEWGGAVIVRALSGTERDAYEASLVTLRRDGSQRFNMENVRARLAALSIVGEDGERLFGDGDLKALGAKSAQALDRVFDAARRLSGLSDEDIEELAEGFGDAPSEGSISA
jgi:hypothetical protein